MAATKRPLSWAIPLQGNPTAPETVGAATGAVDVGLFDDLPSVPAPIQLASKEAVELDAHERIKSIESEVFQSASEVTLGAFRFADIDPEATEPPQAWIDAHGREEALKRFRLAKAGAEGAKTAPAALRMAAALVAAGIKAKAMEKAGPRALAIQFVQMSAPLPDFPRRIVDTNEK